MPNCLFFALLLPHYAIYPRQFKENRSGIRRTGLHGPLRKSFQSGYCLVENRSIAVVNKFFDTEARINTLLDILSTLQYDESKLSEATLNSIKKWKKALDDDTTEEPSDATSTAP
jgi:hypothetical protein